MKTISLKLQIEESRFEAAKELIGSIKGVTIEAPNQPTEAEIQAAVDGLEASILEVNESLKGKKIPEPAKVALARIAHALQG